mgnify:CR=1 FL=1
MIRRHQTMKFLGGYYAFPGGRVDPADGAARSAGQLPRCGRRGGEATFPGHQGGPALAFWVTAVRELLEESGILFACDAGGHAIDGRDRGTRDLVSRAEKGADGRHAAAEAPDPAPLALRSARATLSVALHHAGLEPHPLHRALLPVPRARRPAAGALHRGDVGGLLDSSRRGLPTLHHRRDEDGRARRVRARAISPSSARWTSCGARTPTAGRSSAVLATGSMGRGRTSTGRRIGFPR